MHSRLYLHAPNVHTGGGRMLLYSLISAIPESQEVTMTVDDRLVLPPGLPKHVRMRKVKPSLGGRIQAERWLKKAVSSDDVVLSFGNLPPLYRSSGRVAVFVQNRYLVEDISLLEFAFKSRLRLTIERIWLTSRAGNVDHFIVQTPTMQRLLEQRVGGKRKISVFPFAAANGLDGLEPGGEEKHEQRKYDFLYVASGEPHKNHRRLVEAWRTLADSGMYPSLGLTLDPGQYSELCSWIDRVSKSSKLNISIVGKVDSGEIKRLYRSAGALIYPSLLESFGLPLVEARQIGLPVLASELDYVRDLIDPHQAFDPHSSLSIARAVERYLQASPPPLVLHDAYKFLENVMNET